MCGGHGAGNAATPSTTSPSLDFAVRAALERALADEREAVAAYGEVLADLGMARPFANAEQAESRHVQSLLMAFRRRGETPPEPGPTAPPPTFASLEAACAAAVEWEEQNVAMYDELLAGELPADVRRVFENNRAASRERHLPAFRRCAGAAEQRGFTP
jgi:rubrerythrin